MDETELTPLHPAYKRVARINALLRLLPLLAGAIALQGVGGWPAGLGLVAFVVIALVSVGVMPGRSYRSRGYDMGADRLRVVKGVLFHADTIVPFSRVQHIDVEQGPIERANGIARLILHTAGTHNSSVTLPGLAYDRAVEMREAIRSHLRREAL